MDHGQRKGGKRKLRLRSLRWIYMARDKPGSLVSWQHLNVMPSFPFELSKYLISALMKCETLR